MPADPRGVTADDQAHKGNGGDATAPAPRPNGGDGGEPATSPPPAAAVPEAPAEAPEAGPLAGEPPEGQRQGPGPDPVPPAPVLDPRGDGRDLKAPEPPPAPVLEPPAPAPTGVPPRAPGRGRFGGRHLSARPSRLDRASRRGLRVDQRLWSIDPWSVFKVSALFYFCLGLIILVAGTLLYNAGRSVGTIDQFESFITRIGAYGECVPTAEVPEGTRFEEDDESCDEGEVLVGGFVLDDALLFRAAAIVVTVLVVAGSIGNVLLTVLLNLLNEVTGGLRHTVIREPVARPPGGPPRPVPGRTTARRPAGLGSGQHGSPGQSPQG
jgi:Transmembrane domain of unknown function (DUF3566)